MLLNRSWPAVSQKSTRAWERGRGRGGEGREGGEKGSGDGIEQCLREAVVAVLIDNLPR